MLDDDFETFVGRTGFRRIRQYQRVEEARLPEVPPGRGRRRVAQLRHPVAIVADAEGRKHHAVVTPLRIVEIVPAELRRNQFRREQLRMAFLHAGVDGVSARGMTRHVEGAAARHQVDADADVGSEEESAGPLGRRGGGRIGVGARVGERGSDLVGPLAVGRITFEIPAKLRLKAVGDIPYDIAGTARRTEVQLDLPPELFAIIASKCLLIFVADRFIVGRDDDQFVRRRVAGRMFFCTVPGVLRARSKQQGNRQQGEHRQCGNQQILQHD